MLQSFFVWKLSAAKL